MRNGPRAMRPAHAVARSRPTRVGPGVAALLVLLPAGAAAQDLDDVEVRAARVADGVHMLTGAGGNIGVSSGPDGIFLIDDQYAPLTDRIVAAIREFSDGPIRFVLNTHWHGDHTGGNENLGAAGALIVAHENVRRRMSVDQFIEAFERTFPAAPEGALPIVTFTEAVTFYLNGDEIHAFHAGHAHTDGDAFIHFRRADVIHMGDVFFSGSYPFIDLSSGGSVEGMIAAVERALEIAGPATRIIPGHGPLSTRADLDSYHRMLVTVRDRVQAMVRNGATLEDVLAARPTAELDAEWGSSFIPGERFVGIVYGDLERGNGR